MPIEIVCFYLFGYFGFFEYLRLRASCLPAPLRQLQRLQKLCWLAWWVRRDCWVCVGPSGSAPFERSVTKARRNVLIKREVLEHWRRTPARHRAVVCVAASDLAAFGAVSVGLG